MSKTYRQFALAMRYLITLVTIFTLVIPSTPIVAASAPVLPLLQAMQATGTPFEDSIDNLEIVTTEEAIETPTSQPTAEVSETSTAQAEPNVEATTTPSPTETASAPTSPVRLYLSAQPAQAAPGQLVTFTVTIENLSATPISQLVFINTLPSDFVIDESSLGEIKFDTLTRELTWNSSSELAPEQIIQLTYTVKIAQNAVESLVLDEATVSEADSKSTVTANVKVNIATTDISNIQGSPIDKTGGSAQGLDGDVKIGIPADAVEGPALITIENRNEDFPSTDGEPWVVFDVSLQVGSDTEIIESPAETSTPQTTEPTATETSSSEPVVEPTFTSTPEATASSEVEATEASLTEETSVSIETEIIAESTPLPENLGEGDEVVGGSDVEINATETTETISTPTDTVTQNEEVTEITPTQVIESTEIVSTPTEPVTSQPSETTTPEATIPVSSDTDERVFLEPVEAVFEKPVELTISFDEIADLASLDAAYEPVLVTLDEESGTWVRVPIKYMDRDANTITAEVTHFSTWGAGIGTSFPQNGAGVLLFDSGQPDLFTGHSHYSVPIWTPPGRNGMAPSLALTYSSSTVDGVLGDIQAPWAGMGWSIGSVEIARKITNGNCGLCGGGSYGYKNEFLLLFNGTGYELIPNGSIAGRYHTKEESFLYIQFHNDSLGNNSPAAQNATGEWWEVVERNGTRWRLGWDDTSAHSEQVAAMAGYPGNNTGAWAPLGYAGNESNVVAARWRADLVTDVYGNYMTFSYQEEQRVVAGTSTNYDRANYLYEIQYTKHGASGAPASAYSVLFVRESRGGQEVPSPQYDWDNWDTERLKKIEIKYSGTTIRTYELTYALRSYGPDDSKSWTTTVLDNIVTSGSGAGASLIYAPKVSFTYTNKDNRANCGGGCQEWSYPRLEQVYNGWGGNAKFTYQNDGRGSNSWYNYRVQRLEISDGVSASPMWTEFTYSTPCYQDDGLGWCNGSSLGELVGYGQTTVTTKDFGGSSTLAIAVHKFHTDKQKQGREYEVQYQKPDGTVLSKTTTAYSVASSNVPVPLSLTDQLISYWKLDETSGARNDSVGTNHLASNGGVSQATGKLTSAANFVAASSQSLSIADNASLSTGDIDFTVAAWVYLTDKSGWRDIVTKNNGTAMEYSLRYDSTEDRYRFVTLYGSSGSTVSANTYGSPPTNTWAYIVAWHNSATNTVNIQVNNGPVDSLTTGGSPSDSTAPFHIGSRGNSIQFWNGRIDGVGFWKRVLTADERNSLYNASAGCDYPFTACPPPSGYFIYPSAVETFAVIGGVLSRVTRVENIYDTSTGNLTLVKEFDGTTTTPTLYRQTTYDYQENTSPSVWILGKLWRQQFKDASGTVLSETQYGYDGNLPGAGTLNKGELRLSRAVNGSDTIDTAYAYDATYGVPTDTYTYLNYGNTGSAPSGDYRQVEVAYDSTYTYVTTSELTAPFASPTILPQSTTTDYYFDLGVVKWSVGPNGNPATDADKTRTTYDGLGRVTDITYPSYANGTKNVKYTYPTVTSGSTLTAPFSLKMELWDELATTPTYRSAWAIYDALGRTLQIQGPNQAGTGLIVSDTAYNALGAVLYSGLPRASGTSGGTRDVPNWTSVPHSTASYDALGRVLSTINPDGTSQTIVYDGFRTGVWDQSNHKTVQVTDPFGRLVSVEEYTGTAPAAGVSTGLVLYATTTYQYDQRNSLTQVTDAQSNVTTIGYDAWGRKLTMSDLDMGDWDFTYTNLGALSTQTDARNCVTTMTYDDLGRLLTKVYSGALDDCDDTPDVTYGYDEDTSSGNKSIGLRTSVTSDSNSTSVFYNILGQVETTTQTVEINSIPTDYTTEYTYDAFGRLDDQTYPGSGETLKFYYNAMGLMSRVDTDVSGQDDYVSNINYNEVGQVTNEILDRDSTSSAGIVQEFCYETTNMRFVKIRAYTGTSAVGCGSSPSSPKLNLSYIYDPSGNVTQLTDATQTEITTYGYDSLDRLTDVFVISGAVPIYQKDWDYDSIGNMTAANTVISPPASQLTTQLISYWKVDETSGTRNDSVGTNHLASNGGVSQATGKLTSAANFVAASSQYLSIADNGSLSTGDIDFTVSAWIYLDSKGSTRTIVTKGSSSAVMEHFLRYDGASDRFAFGIKNSSGTIVGDVFANNLGSPSTGTWYYIVAWHDATANTVNISVNNGAVNSSATSGAPSDTTASFLIGARYTSAQDFMNGRIDGVGLWKRILSANERAALYNSGAGCDYPFTSCPVTTTASFQDGATPTAGYAGTIDTQLQQSTATTNYGTATSIKVDGDEPSGGQDVKGLLKWDISSIPSGSTINSVSLVLNVTNSTPNNYYVYEAKRAWVETQATWNVYATSTNWQTAGASGANDVGSTAFATVTPTATGSYTINLNASGIALVQSWVNGTSTNNGFILSDPTSTDGFAFDSSEASTAANRPKLIVNYLPAACTTCSTYTYGDSDHKHAVTSLSTGESYIYDKNGNMVERTEGGITYSQRFDANNKLTNVYDITGGSETLLASFVYDGDGNLVTKFQLNSGLITVYVGGLYEMEFNGSGTLVKEISYYPVGGAMRVEDLVTPANSGVFYILKDHLGSASVILDSSGTVVANTRYYPFGETRISTGALPTDRLFTGQKLVSNIGLYNYGARFYDSKIGRFISADTIVPNWDDPQSLNRYSYVINNPIKLIDPTGHKYCPGGASAACAYIPQNEAVGGASAAMAYIKPNQTVKIGTGASVIYRSGPEKKDPIPCTSCHDVRAAEPCSSCHQTETSSPWLDNSILDSIPVIGNVLGIARGSQKMDWASSRPEFRTEQYKFQTWQDCTLGVCHYPDAVYNKYGGSSFPVGGPRPTTYILDTFSEGNAEIITNGIDLVLFVGGNAIGYENGPEFKFNNNFRLAPWGNRTGNPTGELPHFHIRIVNPTTGQTYEGGGIGWHQPWDAIIKFLESR